MTAFDTVIRGSTVAMASVRVRTSLGIANGKFLRRKISPCFEPRRAAA